MEKNKTKHKCECPGDNMKNFNSPGLYLEEEKIGMYHKPNKCKGTTGLKKYLRRGKEIWLCSCCNIFRLDEEVKLIKEKDVKKNGKE